MKILALFTALAVGAASGAIAQSTGSRGTSSVNRPNSSNFGWQDRQREAAEAQEKIRESLSRMSEAEWKKAALATMAFETGGDKVSFHDVVRIGNAAGDKKSVTRPASGSTDEAPAWVVEFGKKKPKVLTLVLTDPGKTEVRCELDELLSAGQGMVGVFVTDYELFCLARPAG